MRQHPYTPAHMTRTSIGNVAACCDLPEAAHPAFVDGTPARVQLLRDVTSIYGTRYPKGTVLDATRDYREDTLQEVRPSRWFRNERGNMEEERGEFRMVATPGWTIRLDVALPRAHGGILTSIPWRWAREVA